MKRVCITVFALALCWRAQAQTPALSGKTDTIYVTHSELIHVILPAEIKMHALGSASEVEAMKKGRLLFLRSTKPQAKPTSLLIQYGNDQIVKAIILYRNRITNPFYDYAFASSVVGSGQQLGAGNAADTGKVADSLAHQVQAEQKLSQLGKMGSNVKTRKKAGNGITLELTHLYNDETTTYVGVRVTNESTMLYTIEYTSFTYEEKVKKKRQNSLVPQTQEMPPIAQITPSQVESHQSKLLLYALPLYSPNDKSRLLIGVREASGNRALQLSIPAKELLTAQLLKDEPVQKNSSPTAQHRQPGK